MKAITICQPYATLIALGQKRVENRTWKTDHRGRIAIHAGASRQWLDTYDGPKPLQMPFGAVVAIATLTECLPIAATRPGAHLGRLSWVAAHSHATGPWLWILENVERLAKPIPYRGAQGLWVLPDHVVEECHTFPVLQGT